MQTPEAAVNYISPIGYRNSAECGYCRGRRASPSQKRFSYYATTTDLSPGFYQTLIDRCWRRSGTLLYRPNQKNACCPHYTLRLDAAAFKPTKDQRQAINRFNRYVTGDLYVAESARLHPRSREEARRRDTVFDLVERIHEAESGCLPPSPPEPAHEFTVSLEPDTFTEEKYEVFANYQAVVHREPAYKISRRGFTRFLCNSPIRRSTVPATEPGGKERLLGSYHQCYRLDGVLVAIGVLDLLPDCVSAVYFLYHESIHSHNPGKLGALREIALAVEGGYRWWYSGYYIHTCPKMRYKMDYAPQSILDPATLTWHTLGKGPSLGVFDSNGLAAFPSKRPLAHSNHDAGRAEVAEAAGRQPDEGGSAEGGGSGGDGAQGEDGVEEQAKEDDDEDDHDDDEDEEAVDEEEFLLKSNMPGILSLEQVSELDLDNVAIVIDAFSSMPLKTSDLTIWQSEAVSQFPSFKSRIGELAAALGGDVLDKICLDFRSHRRE